MTTLDLWLDGDEEVGSLTYETKRLLNLGYTGRDTDAVQAHIDELADEGIGSPDTIPIPYPKPSHLLLVDGRFEVLSKRTSGEAEFVLLHSEKATYVGVGSDHTDRDVESESISLAKTVCPNVMGETVWEFEAVKDHWDDLELRSWVTDDGERRLYQEATLDAILPPDDLIDVTAERMTDSIEGTAVFGGSVATKTDGFVCGDQFEAELHDPIRDRTISCEYSVEPIDWIE